MPEPGSRRERPLRVVLMAVAVATACGCGKKSPAGTASLGAVAGTVMVERGGQRVAVHPGIRLVVGDIVSTGGDGRAEVTLWSGHVLRLGPISSVAIEGGQEPGTPFLVRLDRGDVQAVTSSNGVRLVIGTPFGRVDVERGSSVEVSSKAGLVVHLGSIDVTFADGKKLTIPTGGRFAPGKPASDAAAGKRNSPIVIRPMRFSLAASSRQVQIRRASEETWQASKPRDTLGSGDSLRTRGAESTRVQVDERTSLVLRPSTDIVAKESGLTADGSVAHVVLRSGSAKLTAVRDGDGAGGHDIEVAGHHLRVDPGAEEANVDVATDQDGRGKIVVNLGRATLPDGQTIEAGSTVGLKGGLPVGAPVPLAPTFVELRAGRKADVYCGGRVPAVRFSWEPDKATTRFLVELARDERYATKLFREEVSRPSLVYALLKPGSWFWRVQSGDTWQTGAVRVEHDDAADCRKCKRLNVVEDTGRDTTVYFQETLPAITLQGTTVTGATKYRMKVYAESSLDKPFIDQTLTTPQLPLGAGRLLEGKYAWNVQALAADSSPLLTGPVSRLIIAYDNAVSGLQIRAPHVGATKRDMTTLTKGEIVLGHKLLINGVPAEIDGKGRFAEKVSLNKGFNQIVYFVQDAGKRDQYWVRDIVAN